MLEWRACRGKLHTTLNLFIDSIYIGYSVSQAQTAHFFRQLLLAGLLMLLAGCGLLQIPPTPQLPATSVNWVEHVRALTLMDEWHIKGKIGIKQGSDGGSAYIDWIQSQDSFHITLSGPFGQGTTIISGNKSGAKLENSEGSFIAETPEQLLYEHSGWQIPISNLLYWIKGLPEPKSQSDTTTNDIGLISTLHQDGWNLRFDRYQNAPKHPLPHKIKILSDNLKVTLLVKQWIPVHKEQ
ncbi:MAG: outer membrane lipoprotein LolB [Moraxellaceae bacterium]|nr:MAG: outer membrane lipoprotein LolB [Moraxellaceae bacterium]